ncbi:MAG: Spy/CpxP family protein refolding chaperone [Campylobacteraceae bacterium]|jgi:Spy/CpxP family protein refolding chaperone|nr:Spy/CpxP family protein refolding chaperone [Campylobacteraceae bacterium]
MKKGLFILVAVSLFAASGAFARHHADGLKYERNKQMFEADGRLHTDDFINKHDGSFLKKLDLGSEQKEQIKLLRTDMFLKMKAVFENANGLKTYFSENSFNKEAFLNDKKEINDALVSIRADYFDKVYNILTAEQRGKMHETLDKIENKWRKNTKNK